MRNTITKQRKSTLHSRAKEVNEQNSSKRKHCEVYYAILYALMIIAYWITAKEYSYAETGFTFSFNFGKFLVSTLFVCIAIIMSRKIKDQLLSFIYTVVMVLLFLGEAVCYAFCGGNSPITLIGTFILLLFLIIMQNSKIKVRESKITKDPMPILLIISVALFIPFLILYHDKININNLFLSDIYETRAVFRDESNQLLGYITAPLSRIILPTLIALSIKKKKYNYLIVCTIMVIFIFLCGALKSILFGLIAILFLYNGDYVQKSRKLLKWLTITLFIGILSYFILDNLFIINLVRRVMFVPPRLNSLYVGYFMDKPTYLSHSPLGLGLSQNIYSPSLSRYFGETVLNSPGLNANVGIIVEGFVSFNVVGLVLFAFLAAVILHYFRWIKIDKIYAGIIFVYIYYMNTSFLSTLLITHGLLFLIIFSYVFMRKSPEKKNE